MIIKVPYLHFLDDTKTLIKVHIKDVLSIFSDANGTMSVLYRDGLLKMVSQNAVVEINFQDEEILHQRI